MQNNLLCSSSTSHTTTITLTTAISNIIVNKRNRTVLFFCTPLIGICLFVGVVHCYWSGVTGVVLVLTLYNKESCSLCKTQFNFKLSILNNPRVFMTNHSYNLPGLLPCFLSSNYHLSLWNPWQVFSSTLQLIIQHEAAVSQRHSALPVVLFILQKPEITKACFSIL